MIKKLAIAVCASALVTGCAWTDETVNLTYAASHAPTHVANAEQHTVLVSADDGAGVSNRVAMKKNGYGMEGGTISSSIDPAQTIRDAVSSELSEKGYKIGPGGVQLDVTLTRFYNDFKVGFFTNDAVADFGATVKIIGADGIIVFTKNFVASGIENNLLLMTPDHAREALDKALAAGVSAIVNDPELNAALLGSRGSQG